MLHSLSKLGKVQQKQTKFNSLRHGFHSKILVAVLSDSLPDFVHTQPIQLDVLVLVTFVDVGELHNLELLVFDSVASDVQLFRNLTSPAVIIIAYLAHILDSGSLLLLRVVLIIFGAI